jgi:predicted NUDIX family NTP pyrophosphohydrolase
MVGIARALVRQVSNPEDRPVRVPRDTRGPGHEVAGPSQAREGHDALTGTMHRMASRVSAGILLFRRRKGDLEVLLAHPGGPYFERKDAGYWTLPKGEVEPGEELVAVALREFEEETGAVPPAGRPIELGSIVQKGGKVVHAWALEGDLDPAAAVSNTFELEWPPRSGRTVRAPEIDRVVWLSPTEARVSIKDTQAPFLDRLEAALGAGLDPDVATLRAP